MARTSARISLQHRRCSGSPSSGQETRGICVRRVVWIITLLLGSMAGCRGVVQPPGFLECCRTWHQRTRIDQLHPASVSTTPPVTLEQALRNVDSVGPDHDHDADADADDDGAQEDSPRETQPLEPLLAPDRPPQTQSRRRPAPIDPLSGIQLVSLEQQPQLTSVTSAEQELVGVPDDAAAAETDVTVDRDDAAADFDGTAVSSDEDNTRPEVSLLLEDARASALRSNLDLQVIRIEPAIAREQISVEEWAFEATFSSALQRNRIDPPPGNFTFGIPPETVTDTWNNGVAVPLYSGGTLSAETTLDRTDGNIPGINSIYDTSTGVTFAQPLLRGGGFNVNTAGIRIAHGQSGIADARAKLVAINVLAETERAYWFLFGARKELQITEQQLEIAEQQLENAKELVKGGVVSRVEILRSRSGLLTRRTSNISAATSVLLAERELKRIIQRPDLPVESATALLPSSLPNPLGLTFERQQLVSMALANRMELLELQIQYLNDSINLDVADNAVLPRLDLRFNARNLGSDPRWSRAHREEHDGNFYDWTAGLTADIPLAGNQSARAARRQAEFARLRTAISQQRQRVIITQDVHDALDRFEQNWQRILNARRSVQAAEEAYGAESRIFELGRRTSDLVLQAAANLAVAQTEEVRAVVDYQISMVDLAVATGTMLGYSHLQWSEAPLRPHFSGDDVPPIPVISAASPPSPAAESSVEVR